MRRAVAIPEGLNNATGQTPNQVVQPPPTPPTTNGSLTPNDPDGRQRLRDATPPGHPQHGDIHANRSNRSPNPPSPPRSASPTSVIPKKKKKSTRR